MRLSTRMSRNLPSLSLRLSSRCLRMDTAFLIRWYRSSGISGARPSPFMMRRILDPVIAPTCSRRE